MAKSATTAHPDGSQSIGRAVQVLAMVARNSDAGLRLSDVVDATKLNMATARRIMQALVHQGLLAFDTKSKIYVIGPAVFSFAVQASAWFARKELFTPVLDRIAQRTSDTAMLSMRSGDEAVCLARREGAFPIRVMSLEAGSRRPLGAGSGSLAILAFIETDERAEIVRRCAPLYETFGLSVDDVAVSAAAARKQGYSFNPGRIIDGVYGIAVPVLSNGGAVGAVSVATIASRMTPARRLEIVDTIRDELASVPNFEVPAALARPRRLIVERAI